MPGIDEGVRRRLTARFGSEVEAWLSELPMPSGRWACTASSSIRAYKKAGFVAEGHRRGSVWHDGRWYDEVMMSILEHEWVARRSPS